MKPFAQILREDRRLVILRLLSERPGYTSNTSHLYAGLRLLGVLCIRDDVLEDIELLRNEALVRVSDTTVEGLYVVELTDRGQSVVDGALRVPGVSNPSPK